jgi:hypothetical protein
MDILKALQQLRDDLKAWVGNNIQALDNKIEGKTITSDDALDLTSSNPVQNKVIALKITEIVSDLAALAEVSFTGDYSDLINAPQIVEETTTDGAGHLSIADESGHIIVEVDKTGINAPGVNIVTKEVDEETQVETFIKKPVATEEYVDSAVAGITISEETIQNTVREFLTDAEFEDITGFATQEYVDGEIVAVNQKIDNLPTPDVSGQIKAHNEDATAHGNLQEKVEAVQASVSQATAGVATKITEHNDNTEAHPYLKTAVVSLNARVGDTSVSSQINTAIDEAKKDLGKVLNSDSAEFQITDTAGNIVFSIDASGTHTTDLTVNNEKVISHSDLETFRANLITEIMNKVALYVEDYMSTELEIDERGNIYNVLNVSGLETYTNNEDGSQTLKVITGGNK